MSPFYHHPPPTPSLNLAHDILADARAKLQQEFGRHVPIPVPVRMEYGWGWSWRSPFGGVDVNHPEDCGEPMDVDMDMNEVEIPSLESSQSVSEAQQLASPVSDTVCNENAGTEEAVQDSSSSVPASSDCAECVASAGGACVDTPPPSAAVHMDPLDADADADGDTDEDEEDAHERLTVLQDVLWNGESDTSSRVDDSFDASLGTEGEDDAEDDTELVLPTVEQQQDIAVVEHFFAHSAAPASPATSVPFNSVPSEPPEAPSSPPSSLPDRLHSAWFWASYSVPWAPRVASPLAACCYLAPSSDDDSPGGTHRKRFRGMGLSRTVNPDERETGIWKMACRSRITEVMRTYKEPTIRALVEQELAEFQSIRGRASTIPWYLAEPDNFDDWSEDDDDFSSSESDDEDEIYIPHDGGNLTSKGDEIDEWETSSWKVESDTKHKSVQVETEDEMLDRGSPASPSLTFTQAFSISGPSVQCASAASSPAPPPSPSSPGCLGCGSDQYVQQHFLPIPPPPLSSMPADLGHLNDDDMGVLEEETASQNVMENSSDPPPGTSTPNSPTSPLDGAVDPATDTSSTQSPPRNPASPRRQRRGGGKGTPVDAGRRRQWFLGLVPDSSSMHGSQPPLPPLPQSHQHASHFSSHQEQYGWSLMPSSQFGLCENTESADAISISMMVDWDRLLANVPSDGSSGNLLNLQRQDHGSHSSLQPQSRDDQTFDWSGNQHQHSSLQQQGQHSYYGDENQQQLHQPQFDMSMMCGSSDYVHSSISSSTSLVGHSTSAVGSNSQMTMTASTLSFALG
jgi:hypothetical protein